MKSNLVIVKNIFFICKKEIVKFIRINVNITSSSSMYELLDIIWPLVKKRPLSDSDNNSIYRVSESKFWKSFSFYTQ